MRIFTRDDTSHGEEYVTLADALAEIDARVDTERERWRALLRTPHRMAGECPDEVAGTASRDINCPACQLMQELGA